MPRVRANRRTLRAVTRSKGQAERVLSRTRSVLLVDWPSRDVPDSLARAGLSVVAQEGPDRYVAYDADGDEVRPRLTDTPAAVDLVYAFRPLGELPDIIDLARSLGAKVLWLQSAADAHQLEEARSTVEAAGLAFISEPDIADAARAVRPISS